MNRMDLMKTYRFSLDELTERAKRPDPNAKGLNLGERFFVELLSRDIYDFRVGRITEEELVKAKKQLETLLVDYWDQAHMFREDVRIRNSMSQTLTEAEKSGCPICKKLVRIFDGREKYESEEKISDNQS